jgi:hypothetical protein
VVPAHQRRSALNFVVFFRVQFSLPKGAGFKVTLAAFVFLRSFVFLGISDLFSFV